MRGAFAFLKKEFLSQLRSGKLLILILVAMLFGVMSPGVAKLTPWMYEMLSDSLAQSGISVIPTEVTALDCWMQFFKNISLALIVFVLLESEIFAKEYSSGTLIMVLTKGLSRRTVVLVKSLVLAVLWSLFYWLIYGISFGYSAFFWDNSVVKNLGFSVFCWWVFGLMVVLVMVLFSVLCRGNGSVLLCTGGAAAISYALGLFPKISRFVPTLLMDGASLIYGKAEASYYHPAIIISLAAGCVCFLLGIVFFGKKQL